MDAVITWVDGSDPAHQTKMAPFLGANKKTPHSAAATRFANCGEIEFCVMSIIRFAPWIDNIYIVTDSQQPQFYASISDPSLRKRIRIVDHKELFSGYELALPVFNSLAIEAMLWNISGLSEDFIYLNDDVMFIRPTPIEAFRADDHYVLKGQMKARKSGLWWHWLKTALLGGNEFSRVSHRQLQENSAAIIDSARVYLDLPHCPHILNRNNLKSLFQKNSEIFKQTISQKFRHAQQLWSVSVFAHFALAQGSAKIDNRFKTLNIKADAYNKKKLSLLLNNAEHGSDHFFICVQSLDMAAPEEQTYILKWLKKTILDDA
jgi:hypothetical protein